MCLPPTPGLQVMTETCFVFKQTQKENKSNHKWEKNIPSSNQKFWVTPGKYKTNEIRLQKKRAKDIATKIAVWVFSMKAKRGSKLKRQRAESGGSISSRI